MKERSGRKPTEGMVEAHAAGHHVLRPNERGTSDGAIQARIRQASLLTFLEVLGGFHHSRVDANENFPRVCLDDEETFIDSYLRRSQSDSTLDFHQADHVDDQLVEIEAGIAGIERLAILVQAWICLGD